MQILLGQALTNKIQFLFIAIKNIQLGLFKARTVLHMQNLSLNVQKHQQYMKSMYFEFHL